MTFDLPSGVAHALRGRMRLFPWRLPARTLLCGAGLLLISSIATASIWMMPERPLSDEERLALSVSAADRIVVARVIQIRDSTFEIAMPPPGSGTTEAQEPGDGTSYVPPVGPLPYKDLTLRPLRWLKGQGNADDVHVGLIEDMDPVWTDIHRLASTGEPVAGVFFLRSAGQRWMIADYPGGYNGGHLVHLDRPTVETPETRAIEAMAARQSLDSLIVRADLVILGHRVPGSCRVRVDNVLAGSVAGDTIVASSPDLIAVGDGPAVFFLRRVSADRFEPVDFRAGFVAVRADTLVRMGVTLDQVFQRATDLRSRQTRDPGTKP